MPGRLRGGLTTFVLAALILPALTAELMTRGALPLWKLIGTDAHMLLIGILYILPFPIGGFVCLAFPRSVYKVELVEQDVASRIPLMNRVYFRELPESPSRAHIRNIRLLGMFVLLITALLCLLFVLVDTGIL